jgi:DNA-binding transcriptional ArsR family regulator
MTDGAEDRAATTREAFELLSDETRLETLRALADRLRENPEAPTLGFSELRRRVGMRDSGNFNYHLGKLEGRFVERTDDGYRIAPAGLRVVAAVITGAYGGGESMGPAELEDPCPVCGAALTATYEAGVLRVACPEPHEFANTLPPGAVDERDLEGVIALLTRITHQDIELSLSGTCPFCYGRLPWSVGSPSGPAPEFDTQCPRCGVRMAVPAAVCLVQSPTGLAFFHDHGIDVRRRPLWAPVFHEGVEVSPTAEGGVTVTVTRDGELLSGRFDASLALESTTREPR